MQFNPFSVLFCMVCLSLVLKRILKATEANTHMACVAIIFS